MPRRARHLISLTLDRRQPRARLVRLGSPSFHPASSESLLPFHFDDGRSIRCTDSPHALLCSRDATWSSLPPRELEVHGECLRRLGAFSISAPASLLNASLQLKKTGLYDFHVANGAKMVPFAGYSMPLSYGNVGAGMSSIRAPRLPQSSSSQSRVITTYGTPLVYSTLDIWSSQSACPLSSLTPHLTSPLSFRGPSVTAFLEWLTPSSLKSLAPYSSTLSVLLNERGGIIDDTIITKHAEDAYYVVTNAGRRDRDLAWFKEKVAEWNAGEKAKADGLVEHEILDGWGLLALQGALSAYVTRALLTIAQAPRRRNTSRD